MLTMRLTLCTKYCIKIASTRVYGASKSPLAQICCQIINFHVYSTFQTSICGTKGERKRSLTLTTHSIWLIDWLIRRNLHIHIEGKPQISSSMIFILNRCKFDLGFPLDIKMQISTYQSVNQSYITYNQSPALT